MFLNWVFSHKKQKSTVFSFFFGSSSTALPLCPLSPLSLSPSSPSLPLLLFRVLLFLLMFLLPLHLFHPCMLLFLFLSFFLLSFLFYFSFSFSSFSWLSFYLIFFVLFFTSEYLLEKNRQTWFNMKRELIIFISVLSYDLRTKIEDSFSGPQRVLMDILSSDLSFYWYWPKAVINHVSTVHWIKETTNTLGSIAWGFIIIL